MTPTELRSLASKYDALGELRRKKARGEPGPDRAAWRAIAKAHPGALKELELLELAELDGRRDALRGAADGARAIEPWMRWIATYHALLREAQLHRGERGQGRLARPPGGRLLPVVVAAIAASHGVAEDEVARAVGVRRMSRSTER